MGHGLIKVFRQGASRASIPNALPVCKGILVLRKRFCNITSATGYGTVPRLHARKLNVTAPERRDAEPGCQQEKKAMYGRNRVGVEYFQWIPMQRNALWMILKPCPTFPRLRSAVQQFWWIPMMRNALWMILEEGDSNIFSGFRCCAPHSG